MTRSTRSAPFRRAREQRFSFAEERKLAMLYTQVQKQFEVENKREIQRATSFSRDFYGLFLSPLFIDELQCNSFFLYTEGWHCDLLLFFTQRMRQHHRNRGESSNWKLSLTRCIKHR